MNVFGLLINPAESPTPYYLYITTYNVYFMTDIKTRAQAVEYGYRCIGDILGRMSIIDGLTSFIITLHLSPNHIREPMHILTYSNFNTKIQVLEKILLSENYFDSSPFPDVLNNATKGQRIRNYLAHSIMEVPNLKDYSKLTHFNFMHMKDLNAPGLDFSNYKYEIKNHKDNVNMLLASINELQRIMKTKSKSQG